MTIRAITAALIAFIGPHNIRSLEEVSLGFQSYSRDHRCGLANFLVTGRRLLIGSFLSVIFPAIVFAHNSTQVVESEIVERERFLELKDEVAPVFTLQDVDGNNISLDDFRGKMVILNFLYSRCQDVCPLHSIKIAEVQAQLALASVGENIQFITIATDTEDTASTAESMRTHGARYGLDPKNWVFLHGPAGSESLGMSFAAAYGLKFVPTDDGEQMHGVVTFLIDTKGQLRARYHGLRFNPASLTVHAAALINEHHNKGEVKPIDGRPANWQVRSIALFMALVALVGLVFITILFYRKRRKNATTHP